jgi:hypothetical protein
MRYFRTVAAGLCALVLSGCSSQRPLNPPVLVTARDTDMAIQLFMQATIMLGRYYGFTTLNYEELRDRSVRHGYEVIPFMPPISRRATPPFAQQSLRFSIPEGEEFIKWLVAYYGSADPHRALITYYVQTGWRAAQIVCRNYLIGLEERNAYLEFLQREFNFGASLANASLIAAGANVTLRAIGIATQLAGNEAVDAYQSYRFLDIDRDAARTLVEAAQNLYAQDFIGRVAALKTLPGPKKPNILFEVASPATPQFVLFSDAIQALNTIEYQCTRSGIRGLLSKAAHGASKATKMSIDPTTNALVFE